MKGDKDSGNGGREKEYSAIDDSVWGPEGKPVLREPDFSDVRRKLFSPVKIIIFLVFSIICWLLFYFVF